MLKDRMRNPETMQQIRKVTQVLKVLVCLQLISFSKIELEKKDLHNSTLKPQTSPTHA